MNRRTLDSQYIATKRAFDDACAKHGPRSIMAQITRRDMAELTRRILKRDTRRKTA